MDQSANQPAASDLATQVAFAKDHAIKGYQIITTALSWAATKALEDALRSQGVEAKGVALDPLGKRPGEFDRDTVVVLGETSPHQPFLAQRLVGIIEERVRTGTQGVHVYLVKGPDFKLLQGPEGLTPQRRKPLM